MIVIYVACIGVSAMHAHNSDDGGIIHNSAESSSEMVAPSATILLGTEIISPHVASPRQPTSESVVCDIAHAAAGTDNANSDNLHQLTGLASWYGGKFQGRRTASGEIFDTNGLTAAHKTLPFNTVVRVVNLSTCEEVAVRINDRGPFIEGRIIDLSRAAAEAIGVLSAGVTPVRLLIEGDISLQIGHTIQIAAFRDRENAVVLLNVLRDAGLVPAIENAKDIGAYRVVLRNIAPDEIDAVRGRLTEIGFSQVLIR